MATRKSKVSKDLVIAIDQEIAAAEKTALGDDVRYMSLLRNYRQLQVNITRLEDALNNEPDICSFKYYADGRKTPVPNVLLKDYNSSVAAMNQVITALSNYIKDNRLKMTEEDDDEL